MNANLIKNAGLFMIIAIAVTACGKTKKAPNVVFVLADEWRAQATGYNGDENVCTHNYNNSIYWGNDDQKHKWKGYDAFYQTDHAVRYIKDQKNNDKPFLMVLSWGPPHTPFGQAPEQFQKLYRGIDLQPRPNVPDSLKDKAVNDLIGYYGHMSALDSCVGILQQTLKETGLDENTIFVFTADHGAMVESHGASHKQRPYEEAINVPLIISYPKVFGTSGMKNDMLIATPVLMPTLLGLCGLQIPETVGGVDKSAVMTGKEKDTTEGVLIASYQPFGQWPRKDGGKEYRGVRTKRYTYVKDLNGPWYLFDNQNDPFQMNNLVNEVEYKDVQNDFDKQLSEILKEQKDEFLPGMDYIKKWNYVVDEKETIPYIKMNYQGLPINE